MLWEHWLSEGQKQIIRTLLPGSDDEKGKRLAQFLAATHDLGKVTPAFQTKRGFANTADLDFLLVEKLERDGFHGVSTTQLANISSTPHALASQYLLSVHGVGDDIASIVGAHHGRPINSKQILMDQKGYLSNYYQIENPDYPVHREWKEAQEAILKWALESSEYRGVDELPEINQPAQVILSGLLIMADWIASNERYFPLIAIEDLDISDPERRIQEGWNRWQKGDLWEPQGYEAVTSRYSKRFGFQPRDVQETFSEEIERAENPGIFILEAPMGIGKTEAAFIGAEQLAAKTGRSGMFFGLPTQATSNGIFPRVLRWLQNVQEEEYNKVSLQLAHGKSALNESFTALSQNINVDEERDASVIVNEWFAGRKTSALDDFVVGTVDQFLLVALKQKHLALRHLGFSKKVVIIDEVHAYDAYMNQYLLEAIRWMGAYKVPIIILSATLPAKRREEMIKYYLRGSGVKSKVITSQFEELHTAAYPLVTYTDGDRIKQQADFKPGKKITVQIKKESTENLFDRLAEYFLEDGVIGIVVNTVKRAQAIAIECIARFGEDNVELLHSSYIATDRAKKENALISMIGKGADRPNKKIIIGTQVIEQSLDIDFDVLFSDLAPMDLLIQRIGRLHRHDIQRPKNHLYPVLYVLDTNESFEFDNGSIAVYGGFLLARTQVLMPEKIVLPDDISPLVQTVYSENPIPLPEELIGLYKQMEREHNNLLARKEHRAKTYRIESPRITKSKYGNNSLIGWLQNPTPIETEERVFAQVRDTQETIEVIALKKCGNGYSLFGEEEDLSIRVNDAEIANKIAQQTVRLPNQLSTHYNIDSTILELEALHGIHFSYWHEQPWLKGALGIIFDEEDRVVLNGFVLNYNKKYGLTYERI